MVSSFRTLGLAAFTIVLFAGAACSDDDGTTGPSVDLSGTYALSSLEQPPNPVFGPPIAFGTLVMTATRYRLNLTIAAVNPPQVVVDSGTYAVSGNTWTQNSEGNPPLPQTVGTFTVTGSILRVDATSAGQRTVTVWNKQ